MSATDITPPILEVPEESPLKVQILGELVSRGREELVPWVSRLVDVYEAEFTEDTKKSFPISNADFVINDMEVLAEWGKDPENAELVEALFKAYVAMNKGGGGNIGTALSAKNSPLVKYEVFDLVGELTKLARQNIIDADRIVPLLNALSEYPWFFGIYTYLFGKDFAKFDAMFEGGVEELLTILRETGAAGIGRCDQLDGKILFDLRNGELAPEKTRVACEQWVKVDRALRDDDDEFLWFSVYDSYESSSALYTLLNEDEAAFIAKIDLAIERYQKREEDGAPLGEKERQFQFYFTLGGDHPEIAEMYRRMTSEKAVGLNPEQREKLFDCAYACEYSYSDIHSSHLGRVLSQEQICAFITDCAELFALVDLTDDISSLAAWLCANDALVREALPGIRELSKTELSSGTGILSSILSALKGHREASKAQWRSCENKLIFTLHRVRASVQLNNAKNASWNPSDYADFREVRSLSSRLVTTLFRSLEHDKWSGNRMLLPENLQQSFEKANFSEDEFAVFNLLFDQVGRRVVSGRGPRNVRDILLGELSMYVRHVAAVCDSIAEQKTIVVSPEYNKYSQIKADTVPPPDALPAEAVAARSQFARGLRRYVEQLVAVAHLSCLIENYEHESKKLPVKEQYAYSDAQFHANSRLAGLMKLLAQTQFEANTAGTEELPCDDVVSACHDGTVVMDHHSVDVVRCAGAKEVAEALTWGYEKVALAREQEKYRLPVGVKLHLPEALDIGIDETIRSCLGVYSTDFRSIHSGQALVLPPAITSLESQIAVIVLSLCNIVPPESHTQITASGEWSDELCAVVGSSVLLGTFAGQEYAPGAFDTNQIHKEASRLMLRGAGVQQPVSPWDVQMPVDHKDRRTDILGRASLHDIPVYQFLGTLAAHYEYDGPFKPLMEEYMAEYKEILAEAGLLDALAMTEWTSPREGTPKYRELIDKAELKKHEEMVKRFTDAWFAAQEEEGAGVHGKVVALIIKTMRTFNDQKEELWAEYRNRSAPSHAHAYFGRRDAVAQLQAS